MRLCAVHRRNLSQHLWENETDFDFDLGCKSVKANRLTSSLFIVESAIASFPPVPSLKETNEIEYPGIDP